ncbi:MAG: hypothetical protein V7605_998 [Acidimicrobiaceae bacterium]|jgi:hypothetical protein
MKLVRRFAALASMTMLGAGGFALATAGPAAAAGGNSTLSCVTGTQGSGAPTLQCTASDPDGVHSVRAGAKGGIFGQFTPASAGAPCSPTPANTLILTFISPFAPQYNVTVLDCQGNKDIYRVDAATGQATFLRTV